MISLDGPTRERQRFSAIRALSPFFFIRMTDDEWITIRRPNSLSSCFFCFFLRFITRRDSADPTPVGHGIWPSLREQGRNPAGRRDSAPTQSIPGRMRRFFFLLYTKINGGMLQTCSVVVSARMNKSWADRMKGVCVYRPIKAWREEAGRDR